MTNYFLPVLSVVALALGGGIFLPGISGYFLFDDTLNIVENMHLQIQSLDFISLKRAAFSSESGMLGRPLSMLSFSINYYFTGLSPFYFKLTNLFIHIVNGICIFFLSRKILCFSHVGRTGTSQSMVNWVGFSVAAAWLLHPLNMSGVLYIVQRMSSLATLFVLLGMITFMHGRSRLGNEKNAWLWILVAFGLFTTLAALSKENGLLLPVFLLLLEVIFFKFRSLNKPDKYFIAFCFSIFVFLPAIAFVFYLIRTPEWITGGYLIRDFTLSERLLTEARIVWFYIQMIVIPDIAQMGMYHDDIPVSQGLFAPLSTFFSVLGLFLLGVIALLCINRYSIAAFGILFFLVGHSTESTVIALELVHEHRNYLPMLGLLLSFFYYLLYPLAHQKSLVARHGAGVIFILMLAGASFVRASQWGDPVVMKHKEVEHHPESIRANVSLAAFYSALPASTPAEAENFYARAYALYSKAAELHPADTLGLFGLIQLNSRYDQPIEDLWIDALVRRIESYPFAPSTGNSIASLEMCVAAGSCKLHPDAMERIIRAALANSSLHSRAKTQIQFAWSDFLFRVRNDVDTAMVAAVSAADGNLKDIDNQITLINMMINMNKLAEAKSRIDKTRLLDKRQLFVDSLNEKEQLIVILAKGQP